MDNSPDRLPSAIEAYEFHSDGPSIYRFPAKSKVLSEKTVVWIHSATVSRTAAFSIPLRPFQARNLQLPTIPQLCA